LKIGESGWIAEVPLDEEQTVNDRFAAVITAGDKASSVADQVVPLGSRELVR